MGGDSTEWVGGALLLEGFAVAPPLGGGWTAASPVEIPVDLPLEGGLLADF